MPPATVPHSQNPRWFILFRILFNCRFYYPIYTIFFLDAGLSLNQFATLNFIWAISIVLLEVPSGALADQLGRRKLIVASAVLMVFEMACLAFLPIKAGGITFWIFVLNRILSGAAEACASGADEALTYDSIPEEGREQAWQQVQAKLMRWQSICFVLTMLIGAFVYQAESVNRLIGWFGISGQISQSTAMKLPVLLCFFMALACLAVALRFQPAPGETQQSGLDLTALRNSFRSIVQTARWLLRSPVPLALLAVGLLGDSFMRLFYTVGSQFYRVIQLPTEWNGPIGAAAALSGLVFAPIISRLTTTLSPAGLYGLVGGLIFIGFLGMAHTVPLWSLWAAVPFWFGMRTLHFALSSHLNAVVPPEQRATALSFRGLSMNLAYGVLMQAFGWQTLMVAKNFPHAQTNDTACDAIFSTSMTIWPWIFAAAAIIVALVFGRNLPGRPKQA